MAADLSPLHRTRTVRPRRLRGVTLIEALIALLLLSFGLLGLGIMHGRAVQYSVDSQDRNRAATLAEELAGAMWAARTVSLPSTTISAWQSRVTSPTATGLPNASGSVSVSGSVATITITWRPPSRASASGNFQYVTKVALP